MKTTLFRQLAIVAVALGLGSLTVHAQLTAPEALPLESALKLKGGKALAFQPLNMKPGQIFRVTHTQFGDGSVRPVGRRAVQLVIYGTTRVDGKFPVLYNQMRVFDREMDAVNTFPDYVNAGESRGIIAVLIGLLLPAVQTGDASPAPLPGGDSISAELHDNNVLIGLLVPAVQKVREAASR